MELNDLFDQKTLEAILADAAEAGIEADEVEKVLRTLPNGGKAQPSRSGNPEGELMSLMGDDKEAVTDAVADAAGVERGKTGTILMLAAPFLLKYLFSNNHSQNTSNTSLLGSLLGMGAQPQYQQNPMNSLLGAFLGGGAQPVQQQSLTSSLLGSMLGAQQPSYASNNTASLLGSLLSSGPQVQAQPVQPLQPAQPVQVSGIGSLMDLMGGGVQQPTQQQQIQQGGGLLNSLFNLFGDM